MKLIFVYNADSGLFNSVSDSIHKLISPKTYPCNLCKITYSTFSIRQKWLQFIKEFQFEIEFLHKNEFIKIFGSTEYDFPVVLKLENGTIETFISKIEINSMKSEKDLIELIQGKFA